MRYPLEPLMTAAGIPSMVALRDLFPMNGTEYRRVLDEGLSERQADRWSVKLGLTPLEVWPEWTDGANVECAATDCVVRFLPVQAHQRYCSGTCSSRQRRRDRYDRDPAYRAQRKADARAYYEACGEYVRRRNNDRRRAARTVAA